MTKRFIFFLLVAVQAAAAQVLPRAGTHFTFGIPEGADILADTVSGRSTLVIHIVSTHEGKGIITSPSGYCKEFTFTANQVMIDTLPYFLMHLHDLGKTNKGIVIKTSQPVNVTFHDILFDAGEATQIYPDEALDTGYHITTWGLYNDPGENNHSQFIVTAREDNTDVTIIPSVNTAGSHRAGVPIQTTLDRGECYIVKADTNGLPIQQSLTHSEVHASKPVSVLSAVSCGYVPLGMEACQEMLDEILPKTITDSEFFVPMLTDQHLQVTVLFTSEIQNFSVFSTNGITYNTSNGWIELTTDIPQFFSLSAPAQCFILSEGSPFLGYGDPSMATVMPMSKWIDTMLWFAPPFIASNGFPFDHFAAVVYPQASANAVLLDGSPIESMGVVEQIASSSMSSVTALIQPGLHTLQSPVPILVIAAGFNEPGSTGFSGSADDYSFLPGGIAPELPVDTIPAFLSITNTDAKTCRTFTATVNTKFFSVEDISSGTLTITYDSKILTLQSVNLAAAAQGGQWTTDAATPGIITISGSCLKPFTDSGAFVIMTFVTGPALATTTITAAIEEMGGEAIYGLHASRTNKDITIIAARDTMKAVFAIDAGHSTFGNSDTAIVRLLSAPNQAVNEIDLFVTHNKDLDSLFLADMRNTIVPGMTTLPPIIIDKNTDEIKIPLTPPLVLSAGILTRLVFQTYITDSLSGAIGLSASLINSRPCPLDILSDEVSSEFTGSDTCGTSTLRSVIRNQPISITSIIPNPSRGSFTVNLQRHIFGGEPVHLALFDELGNEVWNKDYLSPAIGESIPCSVPPSVSSGSYYLRASIPGKTQTRKIVIQN